MEGSSGAAKHETWKRKSHIWVSERAGRWGGLRRVSVRIGRNGLCWGDGGGGEARGELQAMKHVLKY